MRSHQEKMLGEFERLAARYACEAVVQYSHSNVGTLVAQRGFTTRAKLNFSFSAGHNVLTVNPKTDINSGVGSGDLTVIYKVDDDEKVSAVLKAWSAALFEKYLCLDCDQQHRPGTQCVWGDEL